MPFLTINHKTKYRYARPVAFGGHGITLRPLPEHDLRILAHRRTAARAHVLANDMV